MFSIRKFTWLVLGLVFLTVLPQGFIRADTPEPEIPPGFRLILSQKGVSLYRKDYPQGNPDFVQIVNLSQGAGVELLHGNISETRAGKGVYGGDDPRFNSKTLSNYWNNFSIANQNAFCVTNGQFFYMKEYPTRLPFPLKKDGQVLSDGYGIKQFPDQKLILEIWPDHVDIQELTKNSLYGSSAPDIIAGLTEDASKSPSHFVPRTFVGILDQDRDGQFETLLIFNTMTARQSDAAAVLKSFGAEKVMMLDGGGSTQLICEGKDYIRSDRLIPQAVGIFAAPLPPFSATLSTQSDWPVVMTDEQILVQVVLTNTGSLTWNAGKVQLVIDEKPWGAGETLTLQKAIKPGEEAVFVWSPEIINKAGVYSVRWALSNTDDQISFSPEMFNLVVLPEQLSRERSNLQMEVKDWQQMGVLNINPLYKDWLDGQLQKRMQKNTTAFVKLAQSDSQSNFIQPVFILFLIALLTGALVFFIFQRQGLRVKRKMERRKFPSEGQTGEKSGSKNNLP